MNRQWSECMRCGQRGFAKNLIKDGRNPQLLVLTTCGCWDDKHPAEQPFVAKATEGKARFPMSPEILPPEPIVLILELVSGSAAWDPDAWDADAWDVDAWDFGGGTKLSWTRPPMNGVRVEEYEIWRSVAEAAFELLDTKEIEYSDFMEILNIPEKYTDSSAGSDNARYYVEGVTANGRRYRSNTVAT